MTVLALVLAVFDTLVIVAAVVFCARIARTYGPTMQGALKMLGAFGVETTSGPRGGEPAVAEGAETPATAPDPGEPASAPQPWEGR